MIVTFTKNNGKANFPYLVQYKNTENWNSHSGWKDKEAATAMAEELAEKCSKLPVRVCHYTGGPM